MQLQESGEMYLETIYILSQRMSRVHSLDIAEYMNFSKPSVCRAVGLLKTGGMITVDKDGSILLTENGLEHARKIYERHTLLARFLTSLGVNPQTAAEDACRIEHDISDESFDALKALAARLETAGK